MTFQLAFSEEIDGVKVAFSVEISAQGWQSFPPDERCLFESSDTASEARRAIVERVRPAMLPLLATARAEFLESLGVYALVVARDEYERATAHSTGYEG